MPEGNDPSRTRRSREEHTQLAILDQILKVSSRAFSGIDQHPKLQMTLGFVATLALRDLCRVRVDAAREHRTRLLRRLSDHELVAGERRARQIAHDRYRLDHPLSGAAWASIADAMTALLVLRQLDRPDRNQVMIAHAGNIVDAILAQIDSCVAAYVDASKSEIGEAGLTAAARMADPSISTAHSSNPRRVTRSSSPSRGAPQIGIKPNPITLLFPYVIGVYAWQVQGWLVAVGTVAVYLAALVILNQFVIRRSASQESTLDDLIRNLQRVKWVTFALFMMGLGLSSVQPLWR